MLLEGNSVDVGTPPLYPSREGIEHTIEGYPWAPVRYQDILVVCRLRGVGSLAASDGLRHLLFALSKQLENCAGLVRRDLRAGLLVFLPFECSSELVQVASIGNCSGDCCHYPGVLPLLFSYVDSSRLCSGHGRSLLCQVSSLPFRDV